ncbi:hypothetical protein J6590_074271 [Homalodisca vitripennis]|nr:hypothetical protein J6590_074271 [Homalodisca vitripennis]
MQVGRVLNKDRPETVYYADVQSPLHDLAKGSRAPLLMLSQCQVFGDPYDIAVSGVTGPPCYRSVRG